MVKLHQKPSMLTNRHELAVKFHQQHIRILWLSERMEFDGNENQLKLAQCQATAKLRM